MHARLCLLSSALLAASAGCGIKRYDTHDFIGPRDEWGDVLVHGDRGARGGYRVTASAVVYSDDANPTIRVGVSRGARGTVTIEDLQVALSWRQGERSVRNEAEAFDVTACDETCRDLAAARAGAQAPVTSQRVSYRARWKQYVPLTRQARDVTVHLTLRLRAGGVVTSVARDLSLRRESHTYVWFLRDC